MEVGLLFLIQYSMAYLVSFLVSFSLVLGLLTMISVEYKLPIIGQIFGYISTVVEIYLAVPQIISNYKNKSVEGVSRFMVTLWMINDSLKTGYFFYNVNFNRI
jgi:hypothetical protein